MPILAAGLSSLLFGFADFTGGLATRRAAAESVVVASQLAGLALIAVLVATVGSGDVLAPEMAWGAAGGIVGALGLAVLYHALATTPMTVAAPTAAVVGAVLPVVVGIFVLGERPPTLAWLGIAVALPASGLVSMGHGAAAAPGAARRALVLGSIAGMLFGLFGVFLDQTTDASGMWPLASARVASIAAISLVALMRNRPLLPTRDVAGIAVAAGVMDMTANAFFLVALRGGLLSMVAVITAMYPAGTVALAWLVMKERITAPQAVGLVLAAVGVSLIALA